MRSNDREAENEGNRCLLEPEQYRRVFFHRAVFVPEEKREATRKHDRKQADSGEEIHLPRFREKPDTVNKWKRQRDEECIKRSDVPKFQFRRAGFFTQVAQRQDRNENIDENVR